MNILNTYKRTRFFLWVNIAGLAIGLAASIMLILFVVNELSYDKHIANNERIVRLLTVWEENSESTYYGINLRKAYAELPEKVPGVEAAVQIYNSFGTIELIRNPDRFQDVKAFLVDPDFFRVFQMKFIEGTPETALANINSVVLTRRYADIIFGGAAQAMNQTLSFSGQDYTVSAVIENVPSNTHFAFDLLANMKSSRITEAGGLEFYTYYLIKPEASVPEVRTAIEKEYGNILEPFKNMFKDANVYGETEMLRDIYLHSKSDFNLGKRNEMSFIWLLSGLALFILLLAITNFINLFMAQGETRMKEIGIRKTNGAKMQDIIKQFFSEVSVIVLIAFALGLFLAIIVAPYFSRLIQKDIDLSQLLNPVFILCLAGLFVVTVSLSAFYPSFYLSRFTPLEILGKRLKFSKRRLTAVVVIFQSVVTIVLISYILVINKQTSYLQNLPLGYNPENVMTVIANNEISKSYESLKQELLNRPEVAKVSGGRHLIGAGCSGEGISPLNDEEKIHVINTYRIMTGLCELMEFQLVDGEFFKEDAPENIRQIILNEAAVKMLNLEKPVAGQLVNHDGQTEIAGVVKDFYYEDPAGKIQPLMLTPIKRASRVYIRFNDNVRRDEAREIAIAEFRKFDPEFVVNPVWSEDIYLQKFDGMKTQSKIILISALLSLFIAMLGLVAIHLYTTMRRTKEIGIRRVNGASRESVFSLLSIDIIKWIAIAAVFAIPITYYIASEWLNNAANRTELSWWIFALPVLIQCIVAILTTSGVSIKVLSRNPVEALKSE